MIELTNIGDVVNFRAKHTDGIGNFSDNYRFSDIITTEIPCFNLYANRPTDVVLINPLDGTIKKTLRSWLPDISIESNYFMAWNPLNNLLYRITIKANEDTEGPGIRYIESVNLDTLEIISTEITDVGDPDGQAYVVAGMEFLGESETEGVYEFLITNAIVSPPFTAKINTLGEVTVLEDAPGFFGLVFDSNENLRGGSNSSDNLYTINPTTGLIVEDSLVTISVSGFTYSGTKSLACINDHLIALSYLSIGDTTTLNLVSINPTTGVGTNIDEVDSSMANISRCYFESDSESPILALVGQTSSTLGDTLFSASLYEINFTTAAIGSKIIRFTNDEYDDNDGNSIAWNSSDNLLYHLTKRYYPGDPTIGNSEDSGSMRCILESLDPYSLKIVNLWEVAMPHGYYIYDGGDNMYETGNYLRTNKSSDPIIYSHTQNTSLTDFTLIGNGSIQDGSKWFGAGSSYFTNMYNDLFVLVTQNININAFEVSGSLGISGGSVSVETFQVTMGENEYTVFFKKTWGSSNPSVNHLIIVSGTSDGIDSVINDPTYDDFQGVYNIEGRHELYYVLFATRAAGLGSEVTLEQATAIATAFLYKKSLSNGMYEFLVRLNNENGDIVSLIPDTYSFNDSPSGSFDFSRMTYDEYQNAFYVIRTDWPASDLYTLVVDEVATLSKVGNPNDFAFFAITSMASIRGSLYAVDFADNFLIKIDPYTGALLNIGDAKFDTTIASSSNGFIGLANYGPNLYGIAYFDGNDNLIRVDDVVTGGELPSTALGIISSDVMHLAVELVPSQMMLYAVTDGGSVGLRDYTLYLVDSATAELVDIPKKWTFYSVEEPESGIAYSDDYLWRLYTLDTCISFEKIYINTGEVTLIRIDLNLNGTNIGGFAYNSDNDQFLVSLGDSSFYISKTGEATMTGNASGISGLVYKSGLFYGVSNADNILHQIDPITVQVIIENDLTITFNEETVTGISAIANVGGTIYAILNVDADIYLVTLDVSTGVATSISTTVPFNALTSDGSVLWGKATENNVSTSDQQIYIINTSTGEINENPSFILSNFISEQGEAIAYNTDDRKMYHITYRFDERDGLNSGIVIERMDLNSLDIENISHDPKNNFGNAICLTYHNDNTFYLTSISGFYSMDIVGDEATAVFIGDANMNEDVFIQGLAFVDDVLYAVYNNSDNLFTLDIETGVPTEGVTVVVDGYTVNGFCGLACNNGVLYALISETLYITAAKHLMTIDPMTGVGTYIGLVDNWCGLAFGAGATRVPPLIADVFSEYNGKLGIIVNPINAPEGGPSLEHLIVEWRVDQCNSIEGLNGPDDHWQQVEVLELLHDGSNWRIMVDLEAQDHIAVRLAYRNPDSTWYYTHLED